MFQFRPAANSNKRTHTLYAFTGWHLKYFLNNVRKNNLIYYDTGSYVFLYLIVHVIIHFYHLLGAVIICTKNRSQRVLIELFPNRKVQFLVRREGQSLSRNYHDVRNVQLVGLVKTMQIFNYIQKNVIGW